MAKAGRPRETNVSKDAIWKRGQRSGTRAARCSNCGRATGLIQHHNQGALKNESDRRTLCRSCHAAIDNPMKTALGKRAYARARAK